MMTPEDETTLLPDCSVVELGLCNDKDDPPPPWFNVPPPPWLLLGPPDCLGGCAGRPAAAIESQVKEGEGGGMMGEVVRSVIVVVVAATLFVAATLIIALLVWR
jgi:hypothetical protein